MRKLDLFIRWVVCHPSLQAAIMYGKMPGVRRQGRQRAEWLDDIIDWVGEKLPSVVNLARDRNAWRTLIHRIAKAPNTLECFSK